MLRTAQDIVRIRFEVRAPASAGRLFITGDVDGLGSWRPDAIPLRRNQSGLYVAIVALPRGVAVRFKVTQGTWQTVERDADGEDIPDREHVVLKRETVAIEVGSWAKARATRTGTIREVRVKGRTLYVYLPPSYARHRQRRYPVLYMQDGQNMFDAATAAFGVEWRVDETAERLVRERRIEPLIIVGVRNSPERAREYAAPFGTRAGHADRYARFLLEHAKPLIDRRFRTRPDESAVGGSSLGAMVSLYLAAAHPGVFGRCAAFSPSIWYQGMEFIRRVALSLKPAAQKIQVLVGTAEGSTPARCQAYVQGVRTLVTVLEQRGFALGRQLAYREIEGAGHTEGDWAKQVEEALVFLFPARAR